MAGLASANTSTPSTKPRPTNSNAGIGRKRHDTFSLNAGTRWKNDTEDYALTSGALSAAGQSRVNISSVSTSITNVAAGESYKEEIMFRVRELGTCCLQPYADEVSRTTFEIGSHGFQLVNHEASLTIANFESDHIVQDRYNPEMIKLA